LVREWEVVEGDNILEEGVVDVVIKEWNGVEREKRV
jgi:hypothetical protein